MVPYLDAQRLIRELINLSEDLSSGLDVNALGGEIVSAVHDEIPATALGLYVARGETLMPVDTRSAEDAGGSRASVNPWRSRPGPRQPHDHRGHGVRVPARRHRRGRRGRCPTGPASSSSELTDTIDDVSGDAATTAVQLDTALLFSEFRDYATSDERRRLAREMHDGVAQDIASLGYLVDALAARPSSPEQEASWRCSATGSRTWWPRCASPCSACAPASARARASARRSARSPADLSETLRDPDPGHRRRAHRPAPAGGRGRAAPDRPGGDEQRRSSTPGPPPSRCIARSTHRRLGSPSATTAAACRRRAPTPTG